MMIPTDTNILERFLQLRRFRQARKYLNGDVLDFGGNKGELRPLVSGTYTLCNKNYAVLKHKRFDRIIMLGVLEHITVSRVKPVLSMLKTHLRKDGFLILTTPAPAAKPILEVLSFLRIVDRKNILEHKKYWRKHELYALADACGFRVVTYSSFQCGLNNFMVLERSDGVHE